MLIGVKFCGGCNPRYDRGKAFEAVRKRLDETAKLVIAEEGGEYDTLLVIGGCTNCCASISQYISVNDTIKICDETQIDQAIKKLIKTGGMTT